LNLFFALQRYLHENYDYTFETLKENLPKAMESVELKTIWHWDDCMVHWMHGYHSGLGAKEAQAHVKYNTSVHENIFPTASHRHIPERLAPQFDA
jgi:hypothetical protein